MNRHKNGHFSWVDLQATDIEKQASFYEDLFGWSHYDVPTFPGGPPYRMFTQGGKLVAGGGPMPPDMAGVPSMWNSYVAVDDADAAIAKAESLGGQVMMPLMDVMESGRMVGVADPTGGPLFFWQAKDHHGAELYGEHGSIMWHDLYTRDVAAAADYYKELFGWNFDTSSTSDPNYWTFDVDGDQEGGIMLMGEDFPSEVPPHWLPYFAANDVELTTARAAELGAQVTVPPTDVGVAVFSVILDPEGAMFALIT